MIEREHEETPYRFKGIRKKSKNWIKSALAMTDLLKIPCFVESQNSIFLSLRCAPKQMKYLSLLTSGKE